VDDFDDDMDEVIDEFLVESRENLDRLDQEFLALEQQPDSQEILASAFRCLHTIKGTAGFFGFSNLQGLTHAAETLMMQLRDGERSLSTEMMTALLHTVDTVREMVAVIEVERHDRSCGDRGLTAELTALVEGRAPSAATGPDPVPPTPDEVDLDDVPGTTAADPHPEVLVASGADPGGPMDHATPATATTDTATPEPTVTAGGATATPVAESSVRVDVRLLDGLMNLVGELVLARNQILQYAQAGGDAGFSATTQQLNLITSELQEGLMKTRMQPIEQVWSKFPRVVRDLAMDLGKDVRIEMHGKETELDRTLIDAVKDPLTHIVRNAVDHGIESPDARAATGKPPHGTLRLRAAHEGGQVIIDISDDGAGLDTERLRTKAVERGLLSVDGAARLDERDVHQLIFAPGFSTAERVTNVSGRGVGMDVVKTNIERIGGSVEISSTRGHGTTITVRIPLTLAIIPALLVRCGGVRYAIPQVNLVELLRLDAEQHQSGAAIEEVNGAEVYRLRGKLLPIVHLRSILGLPHHDLGPDGEADAEGSTANRSVVVLQADGRRFGLVVDEVSDTEEIVVKPLGPHLKDIRSFAGTTIMGDGAVALILDTIGLAVLGNVLAERERSGDDDLDAASDDPTERRGDVQTVIVCAAGDQQVAVPLALIDRLEQFESRQVEHAAGREVIQYRDRLLSLVDLGRHLSAGTHLTEPAANGLLQVLVHSSGDRLYGLLVSEILDICDTDLSVGEDIDHSGVAFSGVIGRRVTDLVQLQDVIAAYEAAGSPVHAGV
jgi:two-component system, chemotaxis family, sensor kinase CheA